LRMPKELANRLKGIGLAFHNHHDRENGLPTQAIYDDRGKPLLSWRVALLPYLEQKELFKQFRLDEPWDSPHNVTLLDQMPDVYGQGTETRLMMITGTDTVFQGKQKHTFAVMASDGTSQTIMIARAAEDKKIPWTKPVDLDLNAGNPLKSFGALDEPWIAVLFGDGHVATLPKDIPPEQLLRLIRINDSEKVEQQVQQLIARKDFASALDRLVWLQMMAIEPNQGIRPAFGQYEQWVELGKIYPPALEKLKAARDENIEKILQKDHHDESFNNRLDLHSTFWNLEEINDALGESERSFEVFLQLARMRAPVANSLALSFRDELMQRGMERLYVSLTYDKVLNSLKSKLSRY
jgi:hypothetical protein